MAVAGLWRMVSAEADRFRHAMEAEEFTLRYLPQVALARGVDPLAADPLIAVVTGVEALARWRHPERGLLQPDSFIPLAEDTGLIRPLGQWVLRRACADAARWSRAGLHLNLSVNLSASQIEDSLPDAVSGILAETGLEPSRLTLELASRRLFGDSGEGNVAALLQQMVDSGVSLSADDFGTGYSSLRHLSQFPLRAVKIDRSMVHSLSGIEATGATAAIQAILQLAHSCGIEVVAEGVEKRDQRDLLFVLGCTRMQGFHFSAPIDAGSVPGLFPK